MNRLVAGAIAMTLVGTSACSWIAIDTAPRRPPLGQPVTCDLRHWAIGADMGGFVLSMVLGLISGAAMAADDTPRPRAVGLVAGFGMGASVLGASGYYGMHQARRCHSLQGMRLVKGSR